MSPKSHPEVLFTSFGYPKRARNHPKWLQDAPKDLPSTHKMSHGAARDPPKIL